MESAACATPRRPTPVHLPRRGCRPGRAQSSRYGPGHYEGRRLRHSRGGWCCRRLGLLWAGRRSTWGWRTERGKGKEKGVLGMRLRATVTAIDIATATATAVATATANASATATVTAIDIATATVTAIAVAVAIDTTAGHTHNHVHHTAPLNAQTLKHSNTQTLTSWSRMPPWPLGESAAREAQAAARSARSRCSNATRSTHCPRLCPPP